MGRLRKSVVDRIIRLRKQGYTQAETAEKTGVHLKTVQKHDPLRQSKKTLTIPPAKGGSFKDLESDLKTLGDWVESLRWTLHYKMEVDLLCPKCMEGVVEDTGSGFVCQKCGYKMRALGHVWEEGGPTPL